MIGWTLMLAAPAPALAQEVLDPRRVVAAINAVRADPSGYASRLADQRDRYDGRIYRSDDAQSVMTAEGPAALDDAVRALATHPRRASLAWSDVLARAAQAHADAMGQAGARGHFGRDGSDPGDRVTQAGGDRFVGEAIAYGPTRAEDIVRTLIVDDGVRDRGHRQLLMSAEWRHVGAACAPQGVLRTICVVDVAATPDGRPDLPAAR